MKGQAIALRLLSLLLALVLVLAGASTAMAAVWTDKEDYSPGEVVTISGDNSDGAGYLAGETVNVEVSGPNGYTASCQAVADAVGAWSCQVTLWDSELAVGEYVYVARGEVSDVVQGGSFTDGNATISGRVTSAGVGLAGVTVRCEAGCNNQRPDPATTNDQGYYEFSVTFPQQSATLTLRADKDGYVSARQTVTAANQGQVVVDFELEPACTPPSIVQPPAGATVTVGSPVAFSVAASGTEPLSYQWQKNGQAIAGATGQSHEIASVVVADAGSYQVVVSNDCGSATSDPVTLTVNKATPTITWGDPAPVVYGTALGADQLNATADVAGSFVYTPAPGTVLAAGSHTLRVEFTPSDSDNYEPASAEVTLQVTPKPASVTPTGASKTYGDPDPELTGILEGFLDSDGVTAIYVRDPGENSGTYTIRAELSPASVLSNYDITYNTAEFVITKADPVCNISGYADVYDGEAHGATGTCLGVGGETLAGLDLGETFTDVPGGTAHWTFTDVTGNYNDQSGSVEIVISRRPVTVTADPKSKVYGEEDPPLTYQITSGSLVGSDAFSGALARDPGEDVGQYPITQGTLALSNNYELTFEGAYLTITARPITVTADAKTKVYGEPDPDLTYQVTDGSLAFDDAFTGELSREPGEDVGEYAITQGTLSLGSNYDLTFVGANLTITPRPVTVTAHPQSKVYGEADPPLTYAITSGSLAFNDAFSGALSREPGEDVGRYAITQGTLALSDNYELTFVGAGLEITPATLTVRAHDKEKVLNAPNPPLTFGYEGFKWDDDASDLDVLPVCSTPAVTDSPVGKYPITCSGGAARNYEFAYVDGTLSILYATGGTCMGSPGHTILQPIKADGTSVFKRNSTVPAKFRVCDANGASIGNPGVVSGFRLVRVLYGTAEEQFPETVASQTPDTTFRWDSSDRQWIFNIDTKPLVASRTYVYEILLNDGSKIEFQFGLK